MTGVDVGVALGGAEARVAEQLLDRAQIGAARQQVGGEAVTQRVRAAAARERDVPHALRDQRSNTAAAQPAAARVQEERVAARLEPRPLLEPGLKGLLRAPAEEHHALLAALAQ